jgi:hypothetical protein
VIATVAPKLEKRENSLATRDANHNGAMLCTIRFESNLILQRSSCALVDCGRLKQPGTSCRAFRNNDFAKLPQSQFWARAANRGGYGL